MPKEDQIEVSCELKKTKCAPLQVEEKIYGWSIMIQAVKVGFEGFPAASMAGFLKNTGVGGGDRARTPQKDYQ